MRPLRPEVTANLFPRCDLYKASSTEYQYIKYAVCEMNIKISPDRKPNLNAKPIRNPSPFLIPNPMPLTYDFSLRL